MTDRRERLDREYFEDLYAANPDPWNFRTSEYERRKYAVTLDALGTRSFRNALEVGCSIGVFTRMLSERCDALLAVDASERAVTLTRGHLADLPNVTVERRTLPEETPSGEFDLIVASEVLYYLPEETALRTVRLLEDALMSGGLLVAVHWRKETRTYPLQGEDVHRMIRRNTSLSLLASRSEPEYLLDVYEKPEGRE